MNRRGFLKRIFLAGIAPAIVRADSLMRIIPTETTVINDLYSLGYLIPKGEFLRLYPQETPRSFYLCADYGGMDKSVLIIAEQIKKTREIVVHNILITEGAIAPLH